MRPLTKPDFAAACTAVSAIGTIASRKIAAIMCLASFFENDSLDDHEYAPSQRREVQGRIINA